MIFLLFLPKLAIIAIATGTCCELQKGRTWISIVTDGRRGVQETLVLFSCGSHL